MTPPPFVDELGPFEDEMYNLTKNLKFKHYTDNFQQTLSENCNKVKREKKMIIPADKTTNYYLVDKKAYIDLRSKNITKDYKKAGTYFLKRHVKLT